MGSSSNFYFPKRMLKRTCKPCHSFCPSKPAADHLHSLSNLSQKLVYTELTSGQRGRCRKSIILNLLFKYAYFSQYYLVSQLKTDESDSHYSDE